MVVEDFAQPPRLSLLLAVSIKGKGLLCHAWFAEEPPRKETVWDLTLFAFLWDETRGFRSCEGLIGWDDGFRPWEARKSPGAWRKKRIRGRAERREDRSRERRRPNHGRRGVRVSKFREVQEAVSSHEVEREKMKGAPAWMPRSLKPPYGYSFGRLLSAKPP